MFRLKTPRTGVWREGVRVRRGVVAVRVSGSETRETSRARASGRSVRVSPRGHACRHRVRSRFGWVRLLILIGSARDCRRGGGGGGFGRATSRGSGRARTSVARAAAKSTARTWRGVGIEGSSIPPERGDSPPARLTAARGVEWLKVGGFSSWLARFTKREKGVRMSARTRDTDASIGFARRHGARSPRSRATRVERCVDLFSAVRLARHDGRVPRRDPQRRALVGNVPRAE